MVHAPIPPAPAAVAFGRNIDVGITQGVAGRGRPEYEYVGIGCRDQPSRVPYPRESTRSSIPPLRDQKGMKFPGDWDPPPSPLASPEVAHRALFFPSTMLPELCMSRDPGPPGLIPISFSGGISVQLCFSVVVLRTPV